MIPSLALPQEMVGAFHHFQQSLAERYGLRITPVRYLRLCLECRDQPHAPAQGTRVYLAVRLEGRDIWCIFDRHGHVLVTALLPPVEVPRRPSARQDHIWVAGTKRRKYRKGRRKPYKRPKNPKWRD